MQIKAGKQLMYRLYCQKTKEWKSQSTYGWQKKESSAKNWSSLKLAQNCKEDWNIHHRERRPIVIEYEVIKTREIPCNQ